MERKISWRCLDGDTVEHCTIKSAGSCYAVEANIKGSREGKQVDAIYNIVLDEHWHVLHIKLDARIDNVQQYYDITRTADNIWRDAAGIVLPEFNGCQYVDIILTPFTNSLPIKGLDLSVGETDQIEVVYFDLLENLLYKDEQDYTKLSASRYRFSNDGGAFTADIDVDEDGLVTNYPELFQIL